MQAVEHKAAAALDQRPRLLFAEFAVVDDDAAVASRLLAGGIALVLSGAVLLRAVKPLGQRLLNWMEDDEWGED